jgi:hypothetical protein
MGPNRRAPRKFLVVVLVVVLVIENGEIEDDRFRLRRAGKHAGQVFRPMQ